jgi:hypothetical protein
LGDSIRQTGSIAGERRVKITAVETSAVRVE